MHVHISPSLPLSPPLSLHSVLVGNSHFLQLCAEMALVLGLPHMQVPIAQPAPQPTSQLVPDAAAGSSAAGGGVCEPAHMSPRERQLCVRRAASGQEDILEHGVEALPCAEGPEHTLDRGRCFLHGGGGKTRLGPRRQTQAHPRLPRMWRGGEADAEPAGRIRSKKQPRAGLQLDADGQPHQESSREPPACQGRLVGKKVGPTAKPPHCRSMLPPRSTR